MTATLTQLPVDTTHDQAPSPHFGSHFLHGNIVARLMRTGLAGFSASAGALLIASATSMPVVTRAKAENLPSRWWPSPTSMKK